MKQAGVAVLLLILLPQTPVRRFSCRYCGTCGRLPNSLKPRRLFIYWTGLIARSRLYTVVFPEACRGKEDGKPVLSIQAQQIVNSVIIEGVDSCPKHHRGALREYK